MPDFSQMDKAYAEFDRTRFPLITITFTGAKATDDNFSIYLKNLEANYERQEKIGLLFDATKAGFPQLRFQKKQAAWMKAHESTIKTYCLGIAYVVPATVLRQALKMIFAISANPVPFKVFKNTEEGEEWLTEQLEKVR